MKLSRKYFIGKSKPGQWVSVYAYKPNNPEIYTKRAEIFAVICLKGPKDFDVATAGNLLLDHFHETYFENSKDTILVALEKAVLSTHKRLVTLIENNISAMQEGVELDLLSMVVQKDFVYFVNMGRSRVNVLRRGNIIDLTTFLKDPTGEGMIEVGSGKTDEGDKFLLMTPETIEEYTQEDLLDALARFSEVNLKNKLMEDESKIAILLVKVGDSIDEEEADESVEILENTEPVEEIVQNGSKQKEPDLDFTDEVEDRIDLEEDKNEEKENVESVPGKPTFREKTSEQDFSQRIKAIGSTVLLRAKDFVERVRGKITEKTADRTGAGFSSRSRIEGGLSEMKTPVTPSSSDPTYLYILKSILSKLYVGFSKVKKTVWDGWLGFGGDKLYLKGNGGRRNWLGILILIVIVGLVLYFIVNGQIQESRRKDNLKQAEALIESSQKIVDGVKDRVTVALTTRVDDKTRQEILAELNKASSNLDDAAEFGVLEDEIAKGRSGIEDLMNKLNRVVRISPEEVVDLAEHFEDVDIYDIDYHAGYLYVSDTKRNVIYKVVSTGGNPEEFVPAGGGLIGPKSLSIDQNGELIVNDSSEDKVFATIDLTNKSVTKHTGLSRSKIGNPAQIETYKVENSNRIYAIRPENKDVVYYEKSGSGYSFPFSRGKSDDFATGIDVAVDGRVYVLSRGTGLTRYLGARVDPVSIEGLSQGESIAGSTAMDLDATRIFFADPDNRRILIFTKSRGENAGIYDLIVQLRSNDDSDLSSIKEVVVDQQSNTLFFLNGSKIFKVNLGITKEFEPAV